jgi:hypothetical protein
MPALLSTSGSGKLVQSEYLHNPLRMYKCLPCVHCPARICKKMCKLIANRKSAISARVLLFVPNSDHPSWLSPVIVVVQASMQFDPPPQSSKVWFSGQVVNNRHIGADGQLSLQSMSSRTCPSLLVLTPDQISDYK